ncbi:unnamed protein product [Peniophora sp. CBMAI 1063]|nr:unnamed protein product [Peniophora sp. CBMAI 1063]
MLPSSSNHDLLESHLDSESSEPDDLYDVNFHEISECFAMDFRPEAISDTPVEDLSIISSFKTIPIQIEAFYDEHPEYREIVAIYPNSKGEVETYNPNAFRELPHEKVKEYEARLGRHAKAGEEVVEKLGAALRAAGAVELARLKHPHRGFTLKMSPAQRDSFLELSRNRRTVSVMSVRQG